MHGTYNLWLVALSFIVATLASYTALDLSARIALLTRRMHRLAWLAGGATAMGIGIWSMHFIGVLSFSLPIPIGYDFTITGASLVIAIVVSLFALRVIARKTLSHRRVAASAVLMGLGIAGMHYTGDAAMEMQPGIVYDPWLFAASIVIAILASGVALRIAHTLSDTQQRHVSLKRVGAALVMGFAISGMHYTGNAAATFLPGAICGAARGIDLPWLATTVTLLTFAILIVTLMLSRYDARTDYLVGSVSKLNGQIIRMAAFDSLTDLPNRLTLTERMNHAITMAKLRGTQFAVLFMDLDGFKTINDSLGHTVGDEVLKVFARRLLHCVRGDDTVARIGGDEFVLLVEHITSAEDAGKVAEGLLTRMRDGQWDDGQPLHVTPSIGIAIYPQDGDTVETLLKNADAAMYEVKRSGRGTWRYFEAKMNEAATRTLLIQRALHDGLQANYFSLHFQPKFRDGGTTLAGAEALLRLTHPELGSLPPAEFIPIAERSGQIVQIGYWVVREACRHIHLWQDEDLPVVRIAINLSPRQLVQPELVTTILGILETENVTPEQIIFEITESVAMQDAAHTTEMIREFQRSGFEIAIDDFGTGYSSLAYLQRFGAKQLKIDRFFTNGLDTDGHESTAIVSAIIALAHALEMDVVAEGVETPSQLDRLNTLFCDELQGFLLGKPMPGEAFGALLRTYEGDIAEPPDVPTSEPA
ncbi:putative bifunctional diguanylate cyclase/phosphodiesterase [Pararobbsia silviterrae]|uniref:Bifunctional diguanylate cyclase/phosphodiesterase n=1 Tax=Pararobbsia silviterrae TaxID=1792498 RepID=A0A494X8M2_9BURK|nr:EAL domain-containing protein [Pararobbsia silviterrae]RKP47067.1 bifunctional diguanylate cyclase/phosphodiesterase [Pararobbsia silviterrae]